MPLNIASGRQALCSPVWDWKELALGQTVHVETDDGRITRAIVDTVTEDGSIIWLRCESLGLKSLHLSTDPLILYPA